MRIAMPTPISKQHGCKVAWSLYATRQEADQAAEVAKHNAKIDEDLGFDWGYMIPGEVLEVDGGFEVCHS